MSSYIPFDESKVCLNCPKKRCVLDGKRGERCQIIREKREAHRREQMAQRRKACKNFSRSAT